MDPDQASCSSSQAKEVPEEGGAAAGPKFKLTDDQQIDIKEAFDVFDIENTGYIEVNALRSATRAVGFKTENEEVERMINEVDKEGSGRISFESFVHLIASKMADDHQNDDVADRISFRNLKYIAAQLGETLTDEELRDLVDAALCVE